MKLCVVCKRRGVGMTIVGRTKRGYFKWACKTGCAESYGYVDDFATTQAANSQAEPGA